MPNGVKYYKVLLKLTGELFGGNETKGLNFKAIEEIAREVIKIKKETEVKMAIVVGAGNLMRGRWTQGTNVDRSTTDYIGMIGTIMNAMALQEVLERLGSETRLLSSILVASVAEPFIKRRALRHWEKGRILILAGGTGNPYFTTDSAAALRACELNCDVILKGSNVDGVYDKDPNKFPDAKKYDEVNYKDALSKRLDIMDNTAFALCQRENIPIIVFNIHTKDAVIRIIQGEKLGTLIKG